MKYLQPPDSVVVCQVRQINWRKKIFKAKFDNITQTLRSSLMFVETYHSLFMKSYIWRLLDFPEEGFADGLSSEPFC